MDFQAPSPIDVENLMMDRETAESRRALRDHRSQTRVIPAVRAALLLLMGCVGIAHNWAVFGTLLDTSAVTLIATFFAYSLLSLWVLQAFYTPAGRPHLGRLFMRLDVVFGAALIYATGGPKSLLFFLPYLLVGDQAAAGFGWRLHLLFLCALAHISALAASVFIAGSELSLGLEFLKVGSCCMAFGYLAYTARTGELIRRRDQATVALARDLVRDLQRQSHELEAAKRAAEEQRDTLTAAEHRSMELLASVTNVLDLSKGLDLAEMTSRRTRKKTTENPVLVLLVEDNAVNQRVARLLIESWGHSVHVAGNGQIALQAVQNQSFNVVLMDMQMPVMDGIEATKNLRLRETEQGTARIPIVAMTANSMHGDAQRCLDAGMDDYLPKPIDAGALFEKLEAIGRMSAA